MTKSKRICGKTGRKPVDLAELDAFFDVVARLMQRHEKPEMLLPIWRALERERNVLLDKQRIFREAKMRAARTPESR